MVEPHYDNAQNLYTKKEYKSKKQSTKCLERPLTNGDHPIKGASSWYCKAGDMFKVQKKESHPNAVNMFIREETKCSPIRF